MTYAQGGLIQAADFNGFATNNTPNVNNIWGVGSGNSGYGQTPVTSASTGVIINHTEWASLITAINSAALHQGTTMTPLPVPVSNDEIAYLSALSTDINLINTNRLNCAATGSDTYITGTRTASWGSNISIPTVSSTISVTFASANQARYFFNCGGAVLFNCSRTGSPASSSDTDWSTLCDDLGTLGLPAVNTAQTIGAAAYQGLTQFDGSGPTPDLYVRDGFYQLTSTPAVKFRLYAGVYASDRITVLYSATATSLTITVVFADNASDTNTITGNLSVSAVARPPATTNIYNSWGSPVVTVSAPA